MLYMTKCRMHLHTILEHKKAVFQLCCIAGIPYRGVIHDLSKFSPTEFLESAKYYQGDRSPILACKEDKGYSMAWLHHRAHNMHHPEYWVDKLYLGGIPIRMPYTYNVEMICDIIAASKTYNGENYTPDKPYEYWANRMTRTSILHDKTLQFTTIVLKKYAVHGDAVLKRKYTKKLYDRIGKLKEKES